jgi:hypothetical protein
MGGAFFRESLGQLTRMRITSPDLAVSIAASI